MAKEDYLSLQPLIPALTSGEKFQYGRAEGSLLKPEAFNKSARVMARRASEMWQALSLPFSSPLHEISAIAHNNGNAFAEAHGPQGRQFFMARDLLNNQKIGEMGEDLANIELSLLTGICLFSADSAQAVGGNGEKVSVTSPAVAISFPVDHIEITKELSLYEIESVLRLSSTMNTIARHTQSVTNVFLNVPRVEYYAYILDAFEKGFVPQTEAVAWFEEVDIRHDKLLGMLEKRIQKNISSERNIPILDHAPLDVLKGYIKGCINANTAPSVTDAVRLLVASSPLWKEVVAVEPPSSWQDINNLGYVVAQLAVGEQPNSITLVIDNPTESKIYAHAKRIANQLPNADAYSVLGIYPHEAVIPINGNSGKTMYHVEGSPAHRSQDVRTIVAFSRKGNR